MSPYFERTERLGLLSAAAAGWIDTPWAPYSRVRGAGVDCVQLAGAIMIECGVIEEFTPPRYTIDGGVHLGESVVLGWLEASPAFELVTDDRRAGDVLVFRSARSAIEHHVGVLLEGDRFVNAMPRYGVKERSLRDRTWSRLLRCAYRPVEVDL